MNKNVLNSFVLKRRASFGLYVFLLATVNLRSAEPLLTAVRQGDLAAVKKLVSEGAPRHVRDAEGNTALMLATLYAGAGMVDYLLQGGVDVNATNSWGGTALMRGSYNAEMIRLLIEHGGNVNLRSQLGNTALMLAARVNGNSKGVKLLLEQGANVNATNSLGADALMCAAASDDEENVRLLLDRGANLNRGPALSEGGTIWGGGRTPLMWAAFRGNQRIAKLLLDRGAKPDQPSGFGTPLSQAAWNEQTAVAQLLLERGAPVDQTEQSTGFTPLHWAASSESGKTDLVKLLLKAGANPNAEGGAPVDAFMGVAQTPLLLARKRGETAVVRELQRAGAKDSATEPVRNTARPLRKAPLSVTDLRATVSRAVPKLQETAIQSRDSFMRHASKQNCVSCHQQYIPMAAMGFSRACGAVVNQELSREQIELVLKKDRTPLGREVTFHPEPAHGYGYAAFGVAAEKMPSSQTTDEWVHHLALVQGKDGQWHINLPRPPIQTSDIGATALAVQALKTYPLAGRTGEFAMRIDRARKWLSKVKPLNQEERVFQLLGLHWAGEPATRLQKLARGLLAEQREDGGWAQLPKLESDAYGTGQALFALHEAAGIRAGNAQFARGVEYLKSTQADDGTWFVARRAFPFQPTMRSGYSYNRDGWISAAGSSWATMALSLAVVDLQVQSPLLSAKTRQ